MRISGKSGSVSPAQGVGAAKAPAQGAAPVQAPASPFGVDALSVSATAQLIAVAQAELARVPDIRTEKVEALRARLDSDTYSPDGEAVADGLIREHAPAGSRP